MKILLAIDGSDYSAAATDTLIQQIRRENTEVYIFHVVAPLMLIPYHYMGRVQTLAEAQQEKSKEDKELVERTARKLQTAGFRVQTGIEKGDPKEAIIEKVMEWKPDVIFVGSHGRKGIDRFLIGSTSQAVLRHAPCSVEIVRISTTKAT